MKVAFKMKLLPGCAEEYKKRHQALWPELLTVLKESGVSDYTIFLDEETNILFAVQQQSGQSSQDLGGEEIVQRWWAYMADLMETHSNHAPVTVNLKPVFHLD